MMMINTAIEFNNEAARLHNENKFGEALGKLRNAMNSIEGSSLSLDNSAKIEAPKSPLHYNQHLYYKYDEGTRVFTKLLTLCSDDRHKTDYVEAVIAYNLGICYSLQNEFDLASEYFLDVHCVLCSRKFNHTESYIKLQSSLVHINEGHNFFRQGNYEEALASYWDAVNQAKHEGKTNDLIIGAAMNCIGVTVLTQVLKEGHSDKLNIKVLAPLNSALAIFVDHCGDAKAAGPRSKLYMSTIVNNIGRARFYAGDYEGALPFFTKAYLVRESLCDEGDVNVAISSLFVGLCLRKIGDTQGAMDQFNRYISIMLKSRNLAYLGDSIEQIMHLASLFQKDGHDPIAIAFLNIALKCASRQEDGEDLKNSSLQNTIRSKMKTLCSQKAALKLLS